VKLLPDGFTRGFAMAPDRDVHARHKLASEGWALIERPDVGGWSMWMPWLASVGHDLFAPEWVLNIRGRCWFLFGHGIEDAIVRFLQSGERAEEQGRALVAAADLAGDDTVAKKAACFKLLGLEWPPRRGLGAGR
jgi:hypothetical protein